MVNDTQDSPDESKKAIIKKQIEYLHKQLPWKSIEEIAAVFSEDGEVDLSRLKEISIVHFTGRAPEE